MLKRVGSVLGAEKRPFAAVVFTLSSHQPQRVDPRYHDRFGKQGPAASIRCVDFAISEFFRPSEKESWFKDTLFVITGDHTHHISSSGFQTALGRYDVPLIFYHPSRKLPASDANKIVNQIDITPSILDLMAFDTAKSPPFAYSVFDPGHPGQALLRAGDLPSLVTPAGATAIDSIGNPRHYDIEGTDLRQLTAPTPMHQSDEKRLKAYLQFFNNILIENRWSTWKTQ
jgi:phosphoglycerol transferase MdoB-like AlkP superfamily enzyme